MPPKKKPEVNKKTQEKVKAKVVEDKTFGLKNKKGKKQQTYIKNVSSQVQGEKNKAAAEKPKLTKKEIEKQKLDELNALFKPVQKAQVVAAGVDPKSVLCSYFKQGSCHKGNRCKFSHDLSIERKSEKRSLYDDARDEKEDDMNNWDQQTLEDVVNKKHGSTNTTKTEIICKFFLDAVEKNLYGWFWNCPNGLKCMYRHALPAGFVLKRDQKKEDEEEKVSLEEHIENERNELSGELTPVTKETFLAWKRRKIEEKKAKLAQDMNKKKDDFSKGKGMMKISGKEVFLFKPELADADDDEADDEIYSQYRNGDEEDDQPCTEINLDGFSVEAMAAAHIDSSRISRVSTLHARDRDTAGAPTSMATGYSGNDTDNIDMNGLEQACASTENNAAAAAAVDVEIDESLFEDLDDLDLEDGD